MSFLSREFVVLFAVLMVSLLIIRPHSARKVLVLLVSAVFYGWADWRFLFVLASVTVVDYFVAQRFFVEKRLPIRRGLLILSLALNLGFLFAFKYSYFAAVNAARLLGRGTPSWRVALPIGISFYTFETLSYVFDVYRGNAEPAASLLDYAVFVTFFPRLVAGPIMRAPQFLQQLSTGLRLTPQSFASGAQLFTLGLLKKVVLADNLAFFIDRVYADPARFTPSSVWASPPTPIWPPAFHASSASSSLSTSADLTLPSQSPSSGSVGTSPSLRGCAIISISHWEAAAKGR
jgi:alginate O-acetyltransferase complex protein AlgI